MESLIALHALLTAIGSLLAPGTAHGQCFTLRSLLTVLALAVNTGLYQGIQGWKLPLAIADADLESGVLVKDLFNSVVAFVGKVDQTLRHDGVEAQSAHREIRLSQVVTQHLEHTQSQVGNSALVTVE